MSNTGADWRKKIIEAELGVFSALLLLVLGMGWIIGFVTGIAMGGK